MTDPRIPTRPTGSAVGPGMPPPPPSEPVAPQPPAVPPRGWLRRHRRAIIVWAVVAGALVFRLASSSSDSPNLGALKVGDCIDVPTGTTLSKVMVIECSVVHTNEVYAIGDTNTTVNVANTALGNEAEPEIKRICGTDVDPTLFARLTSTAGVEAGYLIGGKRTGRVVCVVTMAPRTGSLVADSTR